MLIECNKCGAPLDVKGSERLVRCFYCGTSTRLQKTRTISVEAPSDFRPSPTWTPPVEARMRARPLHYRRRRRPAGCACSTLVPLLVLAGVAVALFESSDEGLPELGRQLGLGSLPFLERAAVWDGRSTLECKMNERLVIEDREAEVIGGPVV